MFGVVGARQPQGLFRVFCWSSAMMVGFQGMRPVTMWCHGIAYEHGTKIQMRIINTAQPQKPGEYTIARRRAGYPKEARTQWNIAPVDVDDTPAANTQVLATQAQLLSELRQETALLQPNSNPLTLRESMPKRGTDKRKCEEESKCLIKKLFTIDQIALSASHSFWNGKYMEIQDECRAHGVPQCDTLGVKLDPARAQRYCPVLTILTQ